MDTQYFCYSQPKVSVGLSGLLLSVSGGLWVSLGPVGVVHSHLTPGPQELLPTLSLLVTDPQEVEDNFNREPSRRGLSDRPALYYP